MGCFASSEAVVPIDDAPEEPEDPLAKLHAEIERLKDEYRVALPPFEESVKKWRYMGTTIGKLKEITRVMGEHLDDEKEFHNALAYHIADQDAQDLFEASDGIGTDEEKMGRVVLGRLKENIMLTDEIYRKRHGKSLEDLVRGENKTLLGLLGADSLSHFGRFLTYRTMPDDKRDALLFRRCVSGFGCSDYILVEVLSTRTNDQLKAAAAAYAVEFEGEDMVERIKSETGGFGKKWYGKWIDTLVEFDRDESEDVPDNVEELAQQLYDAGAGKWMGCDEQPFIDILCKANEKTCLAIAEAYEALEDTKNSLATDVEKKMGGDLEFAVLARVRSLYVFLSVRIFKACKGWGTDEECLCRILGCLDNKGVLQLRDTYNETYGEEDAPFNDFEELMKSELSGSLLDGILFLLAGLPPKGHWVVKDTYEGTAHSGAEEFKGHVEGQYDDEEAARHGAEDLHGPLHLLNVEHVFLTPDYSDYRMESGQDKYVERDASELLEAPLPDDVDGAEALVKKLKDAVEEVKEETEKNFAAVEGGKAMYCDRSHLMSKTDRLLRQHLDDNAAMLEFCAQRDAVAVHEAVEGWGTDEDKLIRILCSLNKKQLRRIDEIYSETHGKSLRDVTDSELGGMFEGNLKYFMKCAMTPPAELDAELLKDSMAGLGTNDTLLCEIVCTRSNKELREAKAIFAEKEGKSVEEWVEGDTSGFYTTFLLRCLEANRNEGVVHPQATVRQAKKLYKAGFGGQDEERDEGKIIKILSRASEEQVKLIREAYKEEYFGLDMIDAIKESMGGDFEKALLARCLDKYDYYAMVLHNAFSGIGTDERATSRVFGRSTKAELRRIARRYEHTYGGSLRQAVNAETSGHYKKALLTYFFEEAPGEAEGEAEGEPAEDVE